MSLSVKNMLGGGKLDITNGILEEHIAKGSIPKNTFVNLNKGSLNLDWANCSAKEIGVCEILPNKILVMGNNGSTYCKAMLYDISNGSVTPLKTQDYFLNWATACKDVTMLFKIEDGVALAVFDYSNTQSCGACIITVAEDGTIGYTTPIIFFQASYTGTTITCTQASNSRFLAFMQYRACCLTVEKINGAYTNKSITASAVVTASSLDGSRTDAVTVANDKVLVTGSSYNTFYYCVFDVSTGNVEIVKNREGMSVGSLLIRGGNSFSTAIINGKIAVWCTTTSSYPVFMICNFDNDTNTLSYISHTLIDTVPNSYDMHAITFDGYLYGAFASGTSSSYKFAYYYKCLLNDDNSVTVVEVTDATSFGYNLQAGFSVYLHPIADNVMYGGRIYNTDSLNINAIRIRLKETIETASDTIYGLLINDVASGDIGRVIVLDKCDK